MISIVHKKYAYKTVYTDEMRIKSEKVVDFFGDCLYYNVTTGL